MEHHATQSNSQTVKCYTLKAQFKQASLDLDIHPSPSQGQMLWLHVATSPHPHIQALADSVPSEAALGLSSSPPPSATGRFCVLHQGSGLNNVAHLAQLLPTPAPSLPQVPPCQHQIPLLRDLPQEWENGWCFCRLKLEETCLPVPEPHVDISVQ